MISRKIKTADILARNLGVVKSNLKLRWKSVREYQRGETFKAEVRKTCLIKPINLRYIRYWDILWVNGAAGCFILHKFE